MIVNATDTNFEKEVLQHEGVVFVDFWAPWCMPCRILGPIVEKIAKGYEGKVKVVKLNTDENPLMANKYEIMAIPTMMIFKNGELVQNIAGLMPEGQLKQVLDQILAA